MNDGKSLPFIGRSTEGSKTNDNNGAPGPLPGMELKNKNVLTEPDTILAGEFIETIAKKFPLDVISDRLVLAPIYIEPTETSNLVDLNNQPIRSGKFLDHPFMAVILAVGPGTSEGKHNLERGDIVYLDNPIITNVMSSKDIIVHKGYQYVSTRISRVIGKVRITDLETFVDKKVIMSEAYLTTKG